MCQSEPAGQRKGQRKGKWYLSFRRNDRHGLALGLTVLVLYRQHALLQLASPALAVFLQAHMHTLVRFFVLWGQSRKISAELHRFTPWHIPKVTFLRHFKVVILSIWNKVYWNIQDDHKPMNTSLILRSPVTGGIVKDCKRKQC